MSAVAKNQMGGGVVAAVVCVKVKMHFFLFVKVECVTLLFKDLRISTIFILRH